jgi:hypothetical protein
LELIDARTHKGRKPPAHVWEQALIGEEHGNALLALCGPIALEQKMHHERGEGGVATPNKSCTQMQRRKMDYCLGGAVASPNRSCAQRKRGGLKGAELPS